MSQVLHFGYIYCNLDNVISSSRDYSSCLSQYPYYAKIYYLSFSVMYRRNEMNDGRECDVTTIAINQQQLTDANNCWSLPTAVGKVMCFRGIYIGSVAPVENQVVFTAKHYFNPPYSHLEPW